MTAPEEPSNWTRANDAVDPAAAGTGGGLLRRVQRRLARPFLGHQRAFNEAVLGTIVEVRNDLAGQLDEVRRSGAGVVVAPGARPVPMGEELARLRQAVDAAMPIIERQGWAIDAMREVIDDQLLEREVVSQEIDLARQQAFARFHDGLGMLRKELGELSRSLAGRADAVDRRLARAERALSESRLRLAALTGEAGEAEPAPSPAAGGPAPAEALPPPPRDRFAELYASFEDEFRGSEGLIKERVAGYVADLEPLRGKGAVLDVGCGRGDFLAVLKEAGIEAYGIEVSTGYAEQWKLDGLDVRVEDAAEHLAGLAPGSLAALTALQVVEHLSTDQLLGLLERAREVLQPGGLLVLETPNPENVTVGSYTFWLDPTHERPIPAGLLAFLARSQGFEDVEVRYLRWPELHGLAEVPPDVAWEGDVAPVRDVVDRLVFGAQDYAVLARRG